jgi:hypothetical protein
VIDPQSVHAETRANCMLSYDEISIKSLISDDDGNDYDYDIERTMDICTHPLNYSRCGVLQKEQLDR